MYLRLQRGREPTPRAPSRPLLRGKTQARVVIFPYEGGGTSTRPPRNLNMVTDLLRNDHKEPGTTSDRDEYRCKYLFIGWDCTIRSVSVGLQDEMEITGLAEEPGLRGGGGLAGVAGLVVEQCAGAGGGDASALARAARRHAERAPHDDLQLNVLESVPTPTHTHTHSTTRILFPMECNMLLAVSDRSL